MNIIDREKALQKIKRCLALSKSANEHEAAIAMNQARVLMEKYQIDDNDMLALEVMESKTRAGAARKPPKWEDRLAAFIGRVFECNVILHSAWNQQLNKRIGTWTFVGIDPAPEIASYAFAVLSRQVRAARTKYIGTVLKRVKVRENKISRADLFCEGWIDGARQSVGNFKNARSEHTEARINAYLTKKHSDLKPLESKDRNDGKKLRDHHYNDMHAGRQQGKTAQLHTAMNGGTPLTGIGQG